METEREAGLVSMKLSVAKRRNDGVTDKFSQQPAWKEPVAETSTAFNLRCFIFQCRDLPAADSDGSSDPFIKIFNSAGEDQVTSVVEDNVNPIFMECKQIVVNISDTD